MPESSPDERIDSRTLYGTPAETMTRKTERLEIRLTIDEMRELERMAHAMGVSKSDYARAALAIGPDAKRAGQGIDAGRLDALEAAVARMGEALEKLAHVIEDRTRPLTFREWRVRAEVTGDEMPREDAEQARQWLLRQARTYHAENGEWPVPDWPGLRTFGGFVVDPEFLKRWPLTPPSR
jgi:hypothetical protein